MAGIAGASTNTQPATGIAGVGFNVAAVQRQGARTTTASGFESWVAQGIVWAADNGAQVISMSLGGARPLLARRCRTPSTTPGRGTRSIVAAAGNGGADQVGDPAPESPGNCTHVIPVGAIDQNDARASFSNYGPAVPLAAPGVNVLSTNYVGHLRHGQRDVAGHAARGGRWPRCSRRRRTA